MAAMKDKEFKDDAASVKSARRVLSIFRYFEKVRAPRTLSEVSQDLGYPISSTLALLRSIQTLGCLTYNLETKTYFPSMRFAMLGLWIPERLFAGGGIVKMMESLASATQESALLSVQNGLFAQHIHIVATNQPLSYHPTVGTLRPLLTSAVGKVLLSQQPDDQVLKTVEKANAKDDGSGAAVDGPTLLKELAEIRRDGYAYSANLFTPGAASVVMALPVREGDVPMTISVGGPASRINRAAIPRVLRHIRAALDAMEPPGAAAPSDEQVWQD